MGGLDTDRLAGRKRSDGAVEGGRRTAGSSRGGCGLDGCLPAWHGGTCQCVTPGPRARQKPPVAVLGGGCSRRSRRVMVPAVTEPSIPTLADDASPTISRRAFPAPSVMPMTVKAFEDAVSERLTEKAHAWSHAHGPSSSLLAASGAADALVLSEHLPTVSLSTVSRRDAERRSWHRLVASSEAATRPTTRHQGAARPERPPRSGCWCARRQPRRHAVQVRAARHRQVHAPVRRLRRAVP